MKKFVFLLLIITLLWVRATPVRAQTGIGVVDDRATISFPESVTFQAEIRGAAKITSIVLEYGVDQLTCGTVVARAFPQFTSAATVNVKWTWEMLQSGSLPPGAVIWWRWVVTDANGVGYTSPVQTILWLDDVHPWQTIRGGNVNLHYYSGGSTFGTELHTAAAQALARLAQDVGLYPEKPIDLYIYANTSDMRDAILYEPSWTGGVAFSEHNIVIIGISPSDIEWGKRTEAHELTHVLIGHLTFSCLGFVPTWLNEGLAMYGEGGLESSQQVLFDQALKNDSFPSLRSLGGGFSEESDRANLSYSMSYSVVDYLLKTYGRERMTQLLSMLKDGSTPDEALQAVYGFDTDGLEAAWRESVGAASRAGPSAATPAPTPTHVPTIVPFSGLPAAPPTAVIPPTPAGSTPTASAPTSVPEQTPPPSLAERLGVEEDVLKFSVMGVICCLAGAAALAGLFFVVKPRRRRAK